MHKMQKIFLYILLCCEIPLVADAEASATRGRKKSLSALLSQEVRTIDLTGSVCPHKAFATNRASGVDRPLRSSVLLVMGCNVFGSAGRAGVLVAMLASIFNNDNHGVFLSFI